MLNIIGIEKSINKKEILYSKISSLTIVSNMIFSLNSFASFNILLSFFSRMYTHILHTKNIQTNESGWPHPKQQT